MSSITIETYEQNSWDGDEELCHQLLIWYLAVFPVSCLGAFEKLRKTAINSVMPVRPSAWTTRFLLDGFTWNLIFGDFSKICWENSSFIKIRQEKGHFTFRPIYIFLSYLAHFFLEWEMVQTKVTEKIKTHFVFSNFFRKSCRLWDVENFFRLGQATNDIMESAHIMLDT